MNVYTNIAQSNPYAAKAVCHKLGYKISSVRTAEDLGKCLEKIVAAEGEDALKEIMQYHPDKDLIIELFGKKSGDVYSGMDGSEDKVAGCKCGSKCKCGNDCNCSTKQRENELYSNFEGKTAFTAVQTNTFIIAAALILAVAIISKNN